LFDAQRNPTRSYWIPWSYAPTLSEKRNSFLRLLKNKGFKEERRTKVGLYAIGKFTTLESNKSLNGIFLTVVSIKPELAVSQFPKDVCIYP
jgi:hypothetical protein